MKEEKANCKTENFDDGIDGITWIRSIIKAFKKDLSNMNKDIMLVFVDYYKYTLDRRFEKYFFYQLKKFEYYLYDK